LIFDADQEIVNAAENVLKEYEPFCREAIQEFYRGHWPCSYVGNRGRCINVSTKHQKGHQIGNGQVVAAGGYEQERYYGQKRADGDYFVVEVSNQYQKQLQALINEEIHPTANENDDTPFKNEEKVRLQQGAAKNQRAVLRTKPFCDLWSTGSLSEVTSSHSTCFCCLFSAPTHPLPCGHVLCDPCVEDFSRRSDPCLMIDCCPLCGDNKGSVSAWRLMKDPEEAAPRILCLDGFVAQLLLITVQILTILTEEGYDRSCS